MGRRWVRNILYIYVYCISTKPRLEVEESFSIHEPFSERGELKGMLEYPLIYIITYIYIIYILSLESGEKEAKNHQLWPQSSKIRKLSKELWHLLFPIKLVMFRSSHGFLLPGSAVPAPTR